MRAAQYSDIARTSGPRDDRLINGDAFNPALSGCFRIGWLRLLEQLRRGHLSADSPDLRRSFALSRRNILFLAAHEAFRIEESDEPGLLAHGIRTRGCRREKEQCLRDRPTGAPLWNELERDMPRETVGPEFDRRRREPMHPESGLASSGGKQIARDSDRQTGDLA